MASVPLSKLAASVSHSAAAKNCRRFLCNRRAYSCCALIWVSVSRAWRHFDSFCLVFWQSASKFFHSCIPLHGMCDTVCYHMQFADIQVVFKVDQGISESIWAMTTGYVIGLLYFVWAQKSLAWDPLNDR